MRKFSSILLYIIFYLMIVNTSISSETAQIITLDEFIKQSVKNSNFAEILIDELMLVYDEKISVQPGDFVLSITGAYYLSISDDFYHNFKGSVSLSKLFSYTGTMLTGSYSVDPSSGTQPSARTSIGIEQDIIRNAFGRITRIEKKIAGKEKDIARLQIIEAYEEYLSALIALYMEWYLAYENLNSARSSLTDREKLYNNILEKLKYNIAYPIDVHKVELQLLTKQENLLSQELDFNILSSKITSAIGLEQNKDVNYIPEYSLLLKDDVIDFTLSYDNFLKASRTNKILQLTQSNYNDELKVALNDLLPSAKIYGGYSFRGTGYLFESNKSHNIEAGLTMDIDIPQPGSFAEYRKQKIEIDKNKLYLQNTLNDLYIDLKEIYDNYMTEYELIKISEKKNALALSISKEELKDFNQGRSTLNDLIQVYDTVDENRLSKISHMINLTRYYIEWLRMTDTLVTDEKEILK